MKPNSEIKKIVLSVAVLVSFIVSVGNTAFGSTPATDAKEKVIVAKIPTPLSSSWTQTNWSENSNFFNLSSSKNKVYARIWDSFSGGRMFLTNNDGSNWTPIRSADNSLDILSILTLESRILAGTWNGFYQSTDDGITWNAITPTGLPADIAIWCIEQVNRTLYAGTTGAVYVSTDNGNTWKSIGSGIAANARITSLVDCDNTLFAGTASNGIYTLTNNRTSWKTVNTNLTDKHISQLVVFNSNLFAVTLTGVFISENNGTSWAAEPSGLKKVNSLVALNDKLIAGTDDKGVYLFDDITLKWKSLNMGMPAETRVWSLAINSDGLFAGTSTGVWFKRSSTIINGASEISVPSTFRLEQNNPNPFKGSTTFSFYVPTKSFVSLKVYDMQGREVATLFAEETAPGNYSRTWNAAGLSSGIYLYRLQAGSYSETKRLILLP